MKNKEMLVLTKEIERLKEENDRLNVENTQLRTTIDSLKGNIAAKDNEIESTIFYIKQVACMRDVDAVHYKKQLQKEWAAHISEKMKEALVIFIDIKSSLQVAEASIERTKNMGNFSSQNSQPHPLFGGFPDMFGGSLFGNQPNTKNRDYNFMSFIEHDTIVMYLRKFENQKINKATDIINDLIQRRIRLSPDSLQLLHTYLTAKEKADKYDEITSCHEVKHCWEEYSELRKKYDKLVDNLKAAIAESLK